MGSKPNNTMTNATLADGAPLRLRVERQLGYKHAKYITRIEIVDSFAGLWGGNGSYWEDRGYEQMDGGEGSGHAESETKRRACAGWPARRLPEGDIPGRLTRRR